MTFQTPIPIFQAIHNIHDNKYLLPAIQREFVWDHEKIEWLFDSIMRDYPISSFLFWRVEGDTKRQHKFYKFIRTFRERYNTHNEEIPTDGMNDFTAILDGQQRLTALYIGLKGSFAYRTRYLKEENSERVYPTRYLCLNIVEPLNDQEDGRKYDFKFQKEDDITDSWFRVSQILDLKEYSHFNQFILANNYENFAIDTLSKLHGVIHNNTTINFFLEKTQDIDKALNIFIRINSGGKQLDFSDLIMSIAIAHFKGDARKEIYGLVDCIRDKGYYIEKDLILKAFLYLNCTDIRFIVTNFAKSNAEALERNWVKLRDAFLIVFDLVRSFGFTDATLVSRNALLPVIYYVYHTGKPSKFHQLKEYESDRIIIKKWMHLSILQQLFGRSSDTALSQVRRAFTRNVELNPINADLLTFPIDEINKNIRRDITLSDEFIEELLNTQCESKYAFSILALLFPHLDYMNNDFHKDHMHPVSEFKNLEIGCWKTYNSIKNLQFLSSTENQSKYGKKLQDWVSNSKNLCLSDYYIPQNVSLDFNNYDEFISERTKLLTSKLKELLS